MTMHEMNGALLACALGVSALAGCTDGSAEKTADTPAIPELTVAQVADLLSGDAAVAVDANSESIRRDQGVVPNARLLTSSGSYDPAAELPGDRATKLVFYCGNEDCRASDGAAERAREAGYRDVNVMRAGIAGWKAAGQPTSEMPTG